jgi:sarcosine oxidase, subunit gamma
MADAALLVSDVPPCVRLILRGRAAAVEAAAEVLGFALPVMPSRAVVAGGRSALWLGPDEWLILAALSDLVGVALGQAMQGVAHALVDVGHRQVGFELSGSAVAEVLNSGCPLDLDDAAFPVGMCTRTVFGKSEIVLWRVADETFRVEVVRSFAPYVRALLVEAARDYSGG